MAAGYASCATLWIYKRSEVLYKEKNENFPNLVTRFPLAPQALICSHVPKSSSQDGCMNLSLNRVFTKYIANIATSQRHWIFAPFQQHPP